MTFIKTSDPGQCEVRPRAQDSRPDQKRQMPRRANILATILARFSAARSCMGGVRQAVVVATLALALALAGQARAMALVHSPGGAEMVICSDEGMKTIYLDAGGAPAKSPADCRHCPDCIGTPAMAAPPTPVGPASPDVTAAGRALPAGQVLLPSRYLRPETRGPPQGAHGIHDLAPAAVPPFAEGGHSTGPCHRIGRSQTEART
ncbi:DUF2946 family protein [Albidovulum sp.]|uniref:DUF2946 family protein n=1 Tax=Albidovulum sp. TaxID=1872424 RepID=UPI0039B970BE